MRITSGTRSLTSRTLERLERFWIRKVTSISPSSKILTEDTRRSAEIVCSWIPSSASASSILLPDEATSACEVRNAAHVRNDSSTTATVTNCVLRRTRPSRYRAMASAANIADFLLHATPTHLLLRIPVRLTQTVGTWTWRRMSWTTSPLSRPLI